MGGVSSGCEPHRCGAAGSCAANPDKGDPIRFAGLFLDEYDGVYRDSFFSSGEAEFLGGGGFDREVVGVDAHAFGKGLLHAGDMGVELGTFGADGDVGVSEFVAFCTH